MEEHKCCMNAACRARVVEGDFKKGWSLRSGGSAILCNTCGVAYEQFLFCDMFHAKESGWRECNSCGKRLHCGCIASKSYIELLDNGGVQCISCMKNREFSSIPNGLPLESSSRCPKDEKTNGFEAGVACIYQPQSAIAAVNIMSKDDNSMEPGKTILLSGQSSANGLFGSVKHEQVMLSMADAGTRISFNMNHAQHGASQIPKCDEIREYLTDKTVHGSLLHTSLDISLGTCNQKNMVESSYSSGNPHFAVPIFKVSSEEREANNANSQQQVQKSRYLLPKLPRIAHGIDLEKSKDMLPHMRVARPPAEGRVRNQLLPRYWPRITDQELQQISGDSNSTIVPLFEKVLSASDAGRIGRLVLPKACAEAYFPPISQPEGLPLKIQDAKGRDWTFQFRFWPNNNSRMYVLEGVTPCIHSMQLQAGDTVTFSRIDPEGKLVMGFRKATNSVPLQDAQISAIANGALCNDNFISGVIENLPIASSYAGLHQSLKGNSDPHISDFPVLNHGIIWNKTDGDRFVEGLPVDKRKSRIIGSKSKRLRIDNEDSLELKLTWEEVQDLLCPPPTAKPSIVIIDDHEFEEYEEPPILGKRTIFTAGKSGRNDQWAQCDNCSKWRRLPVDVVVPSKWTCVDNTWDPRRVSCSVPDEMSPEELHNFLQQSADFRKRKIAAIYKPRPTEMESSGLDALATAVSFGEDASPSTSSFATTTKHPRHRPGCSCIVCIQPPSGKGPKHKPTCTCNVCQTVKRRFKTLMLRKKKRQTEREEAEVHKKLEWIKKDESEPDISLKAPISLDTNEELEPRYDALVSEIGKGRIDLNSHPERDENSQLSGSSRVSMMSLLQVATLPLENYLKQNGLTSLVCKQQVQSSSLATTTMQVLSEGRMHDESSREHDSGNDEGHGGADAQSPK